MATMYYRPYTSDMQQDDDNDLPGSDAMESVLPEYQYIFRSPNNQPTQSKPPPPHPVVTSGPSAVAVMNHIPIMDTNLDELERYRQAIRRMGSDILALRDRLKEVEMEKLTLMRNERRYEPREEFAPRQQRRDRFDVSRMSREELVEMCESLLGKQDKHQQSLQEYRDKVQKLQNQLIRKNAEEEEYLKLNKAHQQQNSILQTMQQKIQKIKKLEDTVRQQEGIIAKMEEVLEKKNRTSAAGRPTAARKPSLPPVKEVETPRGDLGKSQESSINAALVQENKRLRSELEKAKETQEKAIGLDDTERMELYQLLDKAESRIISLEKQILEKTSRENRRLDSLMKDMNVLNSEMNRLTHRG